MTRDQRGEAAALLRNAAGAGSLWLEANGESMGGLLVSGDRLQVVTSARPPRRGEIWTFCMDDGRIFAHRCVGRARDGRYLFRGDAASVTDPPVRSERLIGRVVAVRRLGVTRPLGHRQAARWALRSAARALAPAAARRWRARRLTMARRAQGICE